MRIISIVSFHFVSVDFMSTNEVQEACTRFQDVGEEFFNPSGLREQKCEKVVAGGGKELCTYKRNRKVQIGRVLRTNEYSKEIDGDTVIQSYSTNHLAANATMEDRSAEARLISSQGSLFGVFDGHSGHSCAEIVSKKLFNYIATALLPEVTRDKQLALMTSSELVQYYRDTGKWSFTEHEDRIYDELRLEWMSKLKRIRQNFNEEDGITKAFLRMDGDIGKAAESAGVMDPAMSGAVACVALIRDRHLYVAGTGDCGAVLGHETKKGKWSAIKMTTEHTAKNVKEVQRLKSQHPPEEKSIIIQNQRLFGALMPLRAFGDFRYKWPTDTLERVAVPTYGRHVVSANYRTPPYLTALPDVKHREISAHDKFLVLATDGLWDVLSPEMVVQLIGDHRDKISTNLKLNPNYYEEVFPQRPVQENITITPNAMYGNPSTYIIRAALGGATNLVRRQLSVPTGEARNIRDDITVTIVFFRSNDEPIEPPKDKISESSAGEADSKTDWPESSGEKVSEPSKDKTGSIGHSAVWEDIENAGRQDGPHADQLDLETALRSGGVIRSRSTVTANEPRTAEEQDPKDKSIGSK